MDGKGSVFLANMSHVIKTPMNAIVGMSDLLLNEDLNSRQQQFINQIKSSSAALLAVIDKILDMSKIESDKLVLSPDDFDFASLLSNMNDVFAEERNEISAKNFYAPSCKALVVDDHGVNLKVAKEFLELFGLKTDTALSGEQAIGMVQLKEYDIVFMDHMMPEMDGVEAAKRIRALGGAYEGITVIALTANTIAGAREMLLSSGFDGFLSKPVEINALAEILFNHLPKEKIEHHPGAQAYDTQQLSGPLKQVMLRLNKIGEINIAKGMINFSHMQDKYVETLQMFNDRIHSECDKMRAYLSDENLRNFAISIHGMKSALLVVGVSEMATSALELEMAAREEKTDYCRENFPVFIERMTSLNEQLNEAFAEENSPLKGEAGEALPKMTPEFLRGQLQAAQTAADDFETDAGINALNALLGHDFNAILEPHIKAALDSIRNYDFDVAARCIGKINALCGGLI